MTEASEEPAPQSAGPADAMSSAMSRAPSGPYRLVWGLALVPCLALLAGVEARMRSQGHEPYVVDDKALWALHRGRAHPRAQERVIVLAGASRMQLDVVPSELEAALPGWRVVQLAIDGAHPLAVLRDMAEDESFDGVVLCAVKPMSFCLRQHGAQQPWVDYYHRQWRTAGAFDDLVNRHVATFLQQRFVVFTPHANPRWLLLHNLQPEPAHVITYPDRSRLGFFRRRAGREGAPRSPRSLTTRKPFLRKDMDQYRARLDEWLPDVRRVRPWVERIRRRGGRVVFISLPLSGGTRKGMEAMYPIDVFWDRIAEATGATTIHYQDSEGMVGYVCPDGSHLDATDAPEFTRALAEELKRLGVVEPLAAAGNPG